MIAWMEARPLLTLFAGLCVGWSAACLVLLLLDRTLRRMDDGRREHW